MSRPEMAPGILYRISAPHFVAGVDAVNGTVVATAPIVAWMRGKAIAEVTRYCGRKGWEISRVSLPGERRERL